MIKNYFLLVLFVSISQVFGQSIVADTQGELTVSGMGSANYKVPIALPPGIKDVAPQLALVYDSSGNNGVAGYGWSLVGVSSINRISTRLDLDGYIDGVNFNENDQFALDGQRLLMESSSNKVLYRTENFSNMKIASTGTVTYPNSSVPGPEKFTITFADGTQAFYGTTANSRGVSEWLIDQWIDVQGNTVKYEYEKSNNVTYIKKIKWSENAHLSTQGYFNEIEFNYKTRLRPETAYLHGIKMTTNRILDYVTVKTGGQLFKKYVLTHTQNELNYQNVSQVQEFNGNNEAANPIVFGYDISPNTYSNSFDYYRSSENNYLNKVTFTGDFDGNGKTDFIASNVGTKLYLNSISSSDWTGIPITVGSLVDPINTLHEGKMLQKQSIVSKSNNQSTGAYSDFSINDNHKLYFKPHFFNSNNNQFIENYTRTVPYPYLNYTINSDGCMNRPNIEKWDGTPEIRTIVGDFNGDGISDYFLIGKRIMTDIYVDSWGDNHSKPKPDCNPHILPQNIQLHFIDMNPLVSDAEASKKTTNMAVGFDDIQFVIDFDGDGKDDLININKFGLYSVYSLRNTDSNILTADVLASGQIAEFNLKTDPNKQLLWGDFNGDGKTDLFIPVANKSSDWRMYVSKGNGFEKIEYNNFSLYEPNWGPGAPFKKTVKIRQYRAVDLNKDGKSDFLMNEYESYCVGVATNGCDRNARGHFNFKPNLGIDGNGKITFGDNQYTQVYSDYGYDDAIHLITGDINDSNYDLIFVQGNQIWKGHYNKDQTRDKQLRSVNEVNGRVVSEITYTSLTPNSTNGGLGDVNGVYHSSNIESYPFVEIKQIPTINVVTKLKVSAMGKSKEREFKYSGLTSHSRGWGMLGFKVMAQSSWVTSGINSKIWQVNQMSPSLRGASISHWSFSGNNLGLISQPVDNQLLGKKDVEYLSVALPDKRYVLLPKITTEKDFLTGVSKKSSQEFDAYYNLKKSTLSIEGTQAKYITDYTYANNPNGTGVNYYIGRLTKKSTISQAYGDSRTSEEQYTYTGNLLTKAETKGHQTDYVTESYQYDGFGNLTQKTTSAPGVSDRTVVDEFEGTGRFVKKKTDVDGLVTTFNYNRLGQLLTQNDPLGGVLTNVYDHWGKLVSTQVSGTSTTPLLTTYSYTRDGNGVLVVTSQNHQTKEYSETHTDVLGRTFKTVTRGFGANSKIAKTTEYDFLGRKVRESEPYFTSSSPTQWNTIAYDALSRPIKQTAFTGKVASISYNGLSATTTENGKTKTVTKDAIGNVASVSDNGQLLTYHYYANDALKATSYGNHMVSIGIDGWGRKISMKDPSISSTPFTYRYNNYGELLEETTPNGVTTYTYTPTGKIKSKKILGDQTDISMSYNYDANGLLRREAGTSDGNIQSTFYFYDAFYRLMQKKESVMRNTIDQSYTYDAFGRVSTETTKVNCRTCVGALGGSSMVSIKNHYNAYNGILDHITDNTSSASIWKLTAANERMQTVGALLGNGTNVSNVYDSYGYIQSINHARAGTTTAALSLDYTFHVQKGTLSSRKNNAYNYTENFTYDHFDRLLSWTTPQGIETNSYMADGRIEENSAIGEYYYYDSNSRYKKSSVYLNESGGEYYQGRYLQEVTYNAFKKPVLVSERGRGSVAFQYGIYGVRNKAVEWVTDAPNDDPENIFRTKYYSSDGSVEIIIQGVEGDGPSGELEPGAPIEITTFGVIGSQPLIARIITYVGGNAYSAPAMYVKTFLGNKTSPNSNEQYHYLHRDYQGSILAISTQGGSLLERRHYDAWGNVVKFSSGINATQTSPDLMGGEFFFDRGYTGHEHFFRVGIIHMNGRVYDPVLKGFMSPDNFIHEGSQGLNRYAYSMNNPLMYIDPSGEEPVTITTGAVLVAAAIGALIGGVVYTGVALYNSSFTWGGLLKSIGIGAVSGAITFGIGYLSSTLQPVSCVSNFGFQVGKAAFQMSMHGVSQGFISGISGGDIGQGFVSGMVSSAVSSLIGGAAQIGDPAKNFFAKNETLSTLLFGSTSGGVSSKLAGGNFWEGAATGLTVSALNHVAHREDVPAPDNGYERDENGGYKEINNEGGDETDYLYENGQIIESTSVSHQGDFTRTNSHLRTYGFKLASSLPAGGHALIDPTGEIVYGWFGGGTAIKSLGILGFNAVKIPVFKAIGNGIKTYAPSLNKGRYFRIGISKANNINSNKGTRMVFRATWGNNNKHWFNIDLGKWGK